jgi:hypothetical protein
MRLGDLYRIVANGAQFRRVPHRGTSAKKAVDWTILPLEVCGLLLFSTTLRPIDFVTTTLPLFSGRHPYADLMRIRWVR